MVDKMLMLKDAVKPTHASVTNEIRSLLVNLNVFHWKQWQGPMSQPNGVADILGIYRGRPLAIEVKGPNGTPTKAQVEFLLRWKQEGGIAIIAHSVDDVIEELGLQERFER